MVEKLAQELSDRMSGGENYGISTILQELVNDLMLQDRGKDLINASDSFFTSAWVIMR